MSDKFVVGDRVSTWRGKGRIIRQEDIGGISFIRIKYDSGLIGDSERANRVGIKKVVSVRSSNRARAHRRRKPRRR